MEACQIRDPFAGLQGEEMTGMALPAEFGYYREFPVQLSWWILTAIGMRGKERRMAVCRMEEVAERTTY